MKRLASVLLRLLCVWTWPDAYRRYIAKITTSGYVGEPSPICLFFARLVLRFAQFVFIGKVRVVGEENLRVPGRLIYCPNHSSMLDAVVMYPTINGPVRAMGAVEVFRNYWGLAAIIMTKMGGFPVDRTNGKTVLGPATKIIVRGERLCMFPEGKISPTGDLLPFKLGAGIIANCAYDLLGGKEPIGIVPIQICYHRRDNATALKVPKMGFKWRGGATVTVHKPIWLHELPDRDPKVVMRMVRDAIAATPCPTLPR